MAMRGGGRGGFRGRDERDKMIEWLQGEFTAANAIIDAISDHLLDVGEPGEYEGVMAALQRRRCNWSFVLNMQLYFPIVEVSSALQEVTQRRQQRRFHDRPPRRFFDRGYRMNSGHGYYRNTRNGRNWTNGEEKAEILDENSPEANGGSSYAELDNGGSSYAELDIANEVGAKPDSMEPKHDGDEISQNFKDGANIANGFCGSEGEMQTSNPIPIHFVAHEIVDGQSVNIVEGLKLYENLFDSSELSKLVSLANELRASGRRGDLQGNTFISTRTPERGHGRESLQFIPSVAQWSSNNGNTEGVSVKEKSADRIPGLFQGVMDRLVQLQIVSEKPDSCIINFYHVGDHLHPHMFPSSCRRPVCVLTLNECQLSFARVFDIDYACQWKGLLKLSLNAGSLVVVGGKSADIAKHAILTSRRERVLVTFFKHNSRISASSNGCGPPFTHQMADASHPTWCSSALVMPSGRPYHPVGPKLHGTIPANVVLQAPQFRAPHLPPPSGTPTVSPVTFAPSVLSTIPSIPWQPRTPPHHNPSSGTGFFLPFKSGQLEEETNSTVEVLCQSESTSPSEAPENWASSPSCEDALGERSQIPECNGLALSSEESADG